MLFLCPFGQKDHLPFHSNPVKVKYQRDPSHWNAWRQKLKYNIVKPPFFLVIALRKCGLWKAFPTSQTSKPLYFSGVWSSVKKPLFFVFGFWFFSFKWHFLGQLKFMLSKNANLRGFYIFKVPYFIGKIGRGVQNLSSFISSFEKHHYKPVNSLPYRSFCTIFHTLKKWSLNHVMMTLRHL